MQWSLRLWKAVVCVLHFVWMRCVCVRRLSFEHQAILLLFIYSFFSVHIAQSFFYIRCEGNACMSGGAIKEPTRFAFLIRIWVLVQTFCIEITLFRHNAWNSWFNRELYIYCVAFRMLFLCICVSECMESGIESEREWGREDKRWNFYHRRISERKDEKKEEIVRKRFLSSSLMKKSEALNFHLHKSVRQILHTGPMWSSM